MNYMGTNRMDMPSNESADGFQPATRTLTPDQRMYMKNHPDAAVTFGNNNYRHGGCMNNSANMGYPQNNSNDSMMMNNKSGMMTTSQNTNTISLRPETMTNTDFLPAYLKQFIGRWVRCEFFIGDTIEQRVGVLHDVGASYIIIDIIEPQTLVVCDIFSLRFVTIVLDEEYGRLLNV